jgi:hypothetical protein
MLLIFRANFIFRVLQGKPADVKINAFNPGAGFESRAFQGKPADVKIDAFSPPGPVLIPVPSMQPSTSKSMLLVPRGRI